MTKQQLKIDMEVFCEHEISITSSDFIVTWHYFQKAKREGRKEGVKDGYKQGYKEGYEKGAFLNPIENGGK